MPWWKKDEEVEEEEHLAVLARIKSAQEEAVLLAEKLKKYQRDQDDRNLDSDLFKEYPLADQPQVTALQEGCWMTFAKPNGKEEFRCPEGRARAVFLGPTGTGKTWCINQIAQSGLPTGVPTKGLSAFLPFHTRSNWVLIDSAGDRPTLSADSGLAVREQAVTDAMIRSTGITMSANVVIVVRKFGYYERELLDHIVENAKMLSKPPSIYVLHNQVSISSIHQLRAYEKSLAKYYGCIPESFRTHDHHKEYELHYLETHQLTAARHLVLGNQHTDDGRRQNSHAFKMMVEWLKLVEEVPKELSTPFSELVVRTLDATLPRHVQSVCHPFLAPSDGAPLEGAAGSCMVRVTVEKDVDEADAGAGSAPVGPPVMSLVDFVFDPTGFPRAPVVRTSGLADEEDPDASHRGYDCVIDIDSFGGLQERGWEISVESELIKPGEVTSDRCTVLSILGMYKRGKTWVLNQIAETMMRDGQVVHTKGISVRVPQSLHSSGLVILDTAGTNMPVMEDKLMDQKATENLLQDVIFTLADHVLIVVNRLTYTDQMYIRDILNKINDLTEWMMQEAKGKKKHKKKHKKEEKEEKEDAGPVEEEDDRWDPSQHTVKLCVVHNLSNISTLADLAEVQKEEFEQCYQFHRQYMQLRHGDKMVNAEYFRVVEGHVEVTHIFLARAGTEAGNRINANSIETLHLWVSREMQQHSLNLFDDVAEAINKNMRKFIVGDAKVQWKKKDGKYRILLKKKYAEEPLMLRQQHIGAAGLVTVPQDQDYIPKFDLWEEGDKYYMDMAIPELPVNAKGEPDFSISVKSDLLEIEGKNPAPEDEVLEERQYLKQSRTFGRFKAHWKPPELMRPKKNEWTTEYKDGVIHVELTIRRKKKKSEKKHRHRHWEELEDDLPDVPVEKEEKGEEVEVPTEEKEKKKKKKKSKSEEDVKGEEKPDKPRKHKKKHKKEGEEA